MTRPGSCSGDAERRRRAEEQTAQHADAQAREQRDGDRAARAVRRREHEAIDAGIQIAERAQPLPQVVDVGGRRRIRLVARSRRSVAATNADSSRSRSARAPNGASARSAVWHSSVASWRAPATPLNDTNVVFLRVLADGLAGFGGIALDVEQVVDDLEREPEVLGEGRRATAAGRRRPRRSARRQPPRRRRARPVLPRWIRSSVSKLICLVGREQIRRLAADQTVESDRIGQELATVRDASDGSYARASDAVGES